MQPRTYAHAGRLVSAMRFVANGPDVARFAGAFGDGLAGVLRVGGREVERGDWVVMDDGLPAVVRQEVFASQYRRVDHADVA